MGPSGRTMGLSLAGAVALLATAGCYKLSSDCALNNNCASDGGSTSGGAGQSSSSETGGAGAASTSTPTGGTGGDTSSGSSGGTGGTTETGPIPTCDPAENVGPVADDCGVFVSGAGSDAGDGSKANPLKTVEAALAQAANGTRRVYACAGSFNEAVALPQGTSLYGGLACDKGWSWDGVQRTTLAGSPGAIPLRLTAGTEPIRVADVTVHAADAVAPGGSSIAVLVTGAIALFARCDFIAGDAMDGLAGAPGGAPIAQAGNGSPGASACGNKLNPPIAPIGGAAANNSCDGTTLLAGMGGLGGIAASGNGGNGEAGDFGAGGPSGTGDKAPPACTNGGPGAVGQAGFPGKGGGQEDTTLGLVDEAGFHGFDGAGGLFGTNGTSGGGGGGSRAGLTCNGASGGAGGAGGCHGSPGLGGTAGGASIALVSLSATLDFSNVHLTVGRGGNGGDGGDGQFGQLGGSGGNGGPAGGGVSGGCAGGSGGDGGNGGPGGGGAGGPSIGVAYVGAAPTGSATVLFSGDPGLGGFGGSNGIEMGGNGISGQTLESLGF